MNFQTVTIIFSVLIVTAYGKPSSAKEEDAKKDGAIRIPEPVIIIGSSMKPKVQQEVLDDLKRIYDQNPDDRRCEQWALSVAEKQRKNFACFKYRDEDKDTGAYYIDRSAQYIEVKITDPDPNIPDIRYVLFGVKRYE